MLTHHALNTSTLRINIEIDIYIHTDMLNTLHTNLPNSHNRKTTPIP